MPGQALHSAEAAPRPAAGGSVAARVRLGANPATPPETLLALAADPAVTVRAAVALNAAAPEQVDRVLARDGDERVRSLLARKLAGLIPGLEGVERERVQGVALSMLETLLQDEAVRVRAAIAEVVRDMPDVPHDIVLRLAHDAAPSVCEQVIRLSPLLSAEDLLGLLEAAPSAVTAWAVARRSGLPEAVSDAVAATADSRAIAALLSNGSASIRESTLDALIARAADQGEWHAPLVRRPVLSARAARALSEIVTSELLDELAGRADLPPGTTQELRRRLALRPDDAAVARAQPEPGLEEAMLIASRMQAEDRLDEAALIGCAQRGEARMASALLAVAAEIGAPVVERAATLRSAKGIVSLVWKAGFGMRAAVPLQTLLARLGPEALLRPTANGGFPLAVEEMRWQLEFLTQMGR